MKRFLAVLIAMALIICVMPVVAENSNSTYREYDEYVVRFKDGYSPYGGAMLMSAEDGEIEKVVDDWNVYTVTEDMISNLDMSKVEYIEPNWEATLFAYPNDPYYNNQKENYLSMIGVSKLWNNMAVRDPKYLAEGVKVAVIDSGIDKEHPDYENTNIVAYDYSKSENNTVVIDRLDVGEGENVSHGTAVAGIIAAGFNDGIGVAGMTKATIYSLKAFSKDNKNNYYNVCKAIKDAVELYDCDVINLSLGFVGAQLEGLTLLTEAIECAYEAGVIVVAASGNTGDGTVVYPAAYEKVISVGAVKANRQIASFSTYNRGVDVVTQGNSVSPVLCNREFEDTKSGIEKGTKYIGMGGTSIASPQVAAAAAIMKAINPNVNHDVMKSLIRQTAVDLGAEGRDDYYGYGLLDIYAMARTLEANTHKIYPSDSVYNSDKKEVEITYFNLDDEVVSGCGSRVAIYDKDNAFVGITEVQSIAANANEGCDLTFEDVEIPEGGHIRIFCMDWDKISPVTEIVSLYL